jgi:hypothetical protein
MSCQRSDSQLCLSMETVIVSKERMQDVDDGYTCTPLMRDEV